LSTCTLHPVITASNAIPASKLVNFPNLFHSKFSVIATVLLRCYTTAIAEMFQESQPESVRRVPVFLAAGCEQNRRHKHGNNHGDNEEWGSYVHRAGSLLFSDYQNGAPF
jgi:hypothetical protein